MSKQWLSIAWSTVLGGIGIALLYENNYFLASLILYWFLSRTFSRRIFVEPALSLLAWEARANIHFRIGIDITKVLNHPVLAKAHALLHESKAITLTTFQEWQTHLTSVFIEKYKCASPWIVLDYRIKSNLLYKNGEVDFHDKIYHEIFIPYDPEEKGYGFACTIELGLTIRVLLVNGFLKVQIGRFSETLSDKIAPKQSNDVFLEYLTISEFPLIYETGHDIPPKYMNLAAGASQSFKGGKRSKETSALPDWRRINDDMRIYLEIGKPDPDETVTSAFMKAGQLLWERMDAWIKKEGFVKESRITRSGSFNYKDEYMHLSIDGVDGDSTLGEVYGDYSERKRQ